MNILRVLGLEDKKKADVPEVHCNFSDLEILLANKAWENLNDIIDNRIEIYRMAMERGTFPDKETGKQVEFTESDYKEIRGAINSLRYVKAMPEAMYIDLRNEAKKKETE